MTLKEEIEKRLRTLQRRYENISGRVSIATLQQGILPSDGVDSDLLDTIKRVVWETREIQSLMETAYFKYGKAVHFLDADLHSFWEKTARAVWPGVRKVYAERHPDGWLEQLLMESEEQGVQITRRESIARTFRAALNYFDDTLDEDDERREEFFEFDAAHELVESPLFRPDDWAENNRLLHPVVQRQTDSWFPKDVRVRIEFLYHAFLFGNWLGTVALSRALLEYGILNRARELQLDTGDPADSRRTAGLGVLVDRLACVLPELSDAMNYLVARGNEVMHPIATRTRTESDHREIAQNCVERARLVLEKLYQHKVS